MQRTGSAVGLSLTWAAAGAAEGFLLARVSPWNPDLPFALIFAPLGFAAGLIVSGIRVVLARQGLECQSIPRFAVWGAVSCLLLAGVIVLVAALQGRSPWSEFLLFGPALTIGSVVCAAGSRAEWHRAPRP